MLVLDPAGADAENHPSATEVVEGHGLPRQHDWIAKRQWRNERTEPYPLSVVGSVRQSQRHLERWRAEGAGYAEVIANVETRKSESLHFSNEPLPARPRQSGEAFDLN